MLVIAYVYFRRLDRSAKRGAERPSLNDKRLIVDETTGNIMPILLSGCRHAYATTLLRNVKRKMSLAGARDFFRSWNSCVPESGASARRGALLLAE